MTVAEAYATGVVVAFLVIGCTQWGSGFHRDDLVEVLSALLLFAVAALLWPLLLVLLISETA